MGAYILVVLVTIGGSGNAAMQRFDTEAACKAAGSWLKSEHYLATDGKGSLAWKCLPAGDAKP